MTESSLFLISFLLGTILGTSAIQIGSFVTFLGHCIGNDTSLKRTTQLGVFTIIYILMLVILIGFLVFNVLNYLQLQYVQALAVSVPIIAIISGVMYIRQYFWHAPIVRFSNTKKISHAHITKTPSLSQPLRVAGAIVYTNSLLILLPIILFSIIGIYSNGLALFWVIPFAIGYILPIYAVLALVSSKVKVSKIIAWKESKKATIYLYCGLALILLAWIVYFTIIKGGNA